MRESIVSLFIRDPRRIELYQAIERAILDRWDDVTVTVHKTQVSFTARYGFAFVSPPFRKVAGRADLYVILSFGLDHRIESPRIVETAHPRENRWTHHVLIASAEEIDGQILDWLDQAHEFGNRR